MIVSCGIGGAMLNTAGRGAETCAVCADSGSIEKSKNVQLCCETRWR